MVVKEIIGVATGVLILAGLSVAVINGKGAAEVLNALGSSFSNVVKAATLRG